MSGEIASLHLLRQPDVLIQDIESVEQDLLAKPELITGELDKILHELLDGVRRRHGHRGSGAGGDEIMEDKAAFSAKAAAEGRTGSKLRVVQPMVKFSQDFRRKRVLVEHSFQDAHGGAEAVAAIGLRRQHGFLFHRPGDTEQSADRIKRAGQITVLGTEQRLELQELNGGR